LEHPISPLIKVNLNRERRKRRSSISQVHSTLQPSTTLGFETVTISLNINYAISKNGTWHCSQQYSLSYFLKHCLPLLLSSTKLVL
jgi:hypothetical protein